MTAAADRGYLSIGEVLSLLQDDFPDVTISKIRFLESQGLIDPERTPSGYRKFYADDVKRLRFILHEQRANFLPLRVIRDRLGNPIEVAPTDVDSDRPAPSSSYGAASPAGDAPSPPPATFVAPVASMPSIAAVPDAPAAPAADPPADPPVVAAADAASVAMAMATGVSMTPDELVRASGLSSAHLRELESYGLIVGRVVGRAHVYDEEGLAIAKLAAGFIRHGIEPRHLRMYKTGVEREATLFEQAVLPMLKQRNPTARAQALDTLRTLVDHGEGLRVLLARRVLQAYQSPSTGNPDR